MRTLKLQVQMTVDGYVGGPNGEMDFASRDWGEDIAKYVGDLSAPVECIVLGRKLAQGFIPHWAANPQLPGADLFNGAQKVVFTKSLESSPWDKTSLAKGDLVEEITALKNQPGGDIIAYGGATFVSGLIKHGLIDDYHLFINPSAIGKGLNIFKELDGKQGLSLVKATTFTCGIVVLHYQPRRL